MEKDFLARNRAKIVDYLDCAQLKCEEAERLNILKQDSKEYQLELAAEKLDVALLIKHAAMSRSP